MESTSTVTSNFRRKINNSIPGEQPAGETLAPKNNYEADYVRRALNAHTLELPNREQTPVFFDALVSLHKAHSRGGIVAARDIWERIVKPACPKLAIMIGESVQTAPDAKRWSFTPAKKLYDLLPVKYLHEDLIVDGGLNVLFGPSGLGKSFMAVDWSLNIAQVAGVLYVAPEGYRGYADRVKAWCNHHKKDEGKLFFTDEPVNLLDKQSVEMFILELQMSGVQPALIVFDTLARCMVGGDENSARDMGLVIHHCEEIQKALKTAVLLVHHTGKNAASGERGSSALRGAADMMIKLEDMDGSIKMICDKTKDAEPFADRFITMMNIPAREGNTSLVPIASAKITETDDDSLRLTQNQRFILELLNLEIYTQRGDNDERLGAKYNELQREIPHTINLGRTLSQLAKRGLVDRPDNKRDPWRITYLGQDALGNPSKDSKSIQISERAKIKSVRKAYGIEAEK